jgi:hypothetical protein
MLYGKLTEDELIDFLKKCDNYARVMFKNDDENSYSAAAVAEVHYHLRAAQEILATGEVLPKSRKSAIRKKGQVFSGEARISALFK